LVRLSQQLRTLVTKSGKLEVVDIALVEDEARKANLQKCGGCDADLAEKLGAEISITGTVQKVSNLILNINLYARVVATKEPLVAMSVDIRGNTDESWSRGLEYLVRTRGPFRCATSQPTGPIGGMSATSGPGTSFGPCRLSCRRRTAS
jgi:Protein of unknown function (DUF2380)